MKPVRLTAEYCYKRFFLQVQPHVTKLVATIQGMPPLQDRQAYALLLIQRLLVLYFLQQKSLLHKDRNFLHTELCRMQAYQENAFYRSFLRPLFKAITGSSSIYTSPVSRTTTLPVFPLFLFAPHTLEECYPDLDIADTYFVDLFAFLDRYQWQADERPPQTPTELSPALLGSLFEQQVDQKQMGAYYTSEDVTTYSVCNTVIPALFQCMARQVPNLFSSQADLWQLLRNAPDRYIPASLRTPSYLARETEQEYTVRRLRYQQLYNELSLGAITSIDTLITHNLSLELLALDMLAQCRDAETLYLCYHTLRQLRILDPTCGTGAFLCTTLRILKKLYKACLTRMHELSSGVESAPYDATFEEIFRTFSGYPSLDYFVVDSIITHNLYGMDIMPGAVDVCRQRLLLYLFAQLPDDQAPIYPLPQVQKTIQQGDVLAGNLSNFALNTFDVIIGNPPYIEYSMFRHMHNNNGYKNNFGNMYAAIVEQALAVCKSQTGYLGLLLPVSLCTGERFAYLREMVSKQTSQRWIANFEIFPCRLLDGAFQRLSLLLARRQSLSTSDTKNNDCFRLYENTCVTKLQRWYSVERVHLLELMTYTQVRYPLKPGIFPKLAGHLHEEILWKVFRGAAGACIGDALCCTPTANSVYYQEATNYWLKASRRVPLHYKNGQQHIPAHGRFLFCRNNCTANTLMALLNSGLFYLWFVAYSDGFHLAHNLVKEFPVVKGIYNDAALLELAQHLELDIQRHIQRSTRNTKTGDHIEIEEYRMALSKPLLDSIDTILANQYGLDDEELAFILNYDSKYRMGRS